jgi:hypothetical protein
MSSYQEEQQDSPLHKRAVLDVSVLPDRLKGLKTEADRKPGAANAEMCCCRLAIVVGVTISRKGSPRATQVSWGNLNRLVHVNRLDVNALLDD